MRRLAGTLGLLAIFVLVLALATFVRLNPSFDPLADFISKLGAIGQPHAFWWNLIGFGTVGLLLAGFGWAYGESIGDRAVGALLVVFGSGFAATAVPMDLANEVSGLSKAHVVAICIGLAAFMFALARMAHIRSGERSIRILANVAAALLGLVIAGQLVQAWSMPVTHRLVFLVVLGWVAATSVRLLRGRGSEGALSS